MIHFAERALKANPVKRETTIWKQMTDRHAYEAKPHS